jgi:uncharacterized protein YegJ (DUF2314 family)
MRVSFFLFLLCLISIGCKKPLPDTLITAGYDHEAMDAAIDRARSEVDLFVQELMNPTGISHSVKVPIEDGSEVEHFWLTDITFNDGQFEGVIGNEPGIVRNVKYGQKWTVKKHEISDWLYLKDKKMYGNYTIRPLLDTMPPEQAEQLRAILAD